VVGDGLPVAVEGKGETRRESSQSERWHASAGCSVPIQFRSCAVRACQAIVGVGRSVVLSSGRVHALVMSCGSDDTQQTRQARCTWFIRENVCIGFSPPPFGVVLFIITNGKENPRLDGWDWEVLLTTGGVTDSAKGSFIWRP
jgi:hypothetical protein